MTLAVALPGSTRRRTYRGQPATDRRWRPATDWRRTGRATCWRRTGARPLASSRPPTRNDSGDRRSQPRGVYERWGGPIRMFSAADDCSLGHMFSAADECSPVALAVALYHPWNGPVLLWLCVTVASADCIVIVVLEVIIA